MLYYWNDYYAHNDDDNDEYYDNNEDNDNDECDINANYFSNSKINQRNMNCLFAGLLSNVFGINQTKLASNGVTSK